MHMRAGAVVVALIGAAACSGTDTGENATESAPERNPVPTTPVPTTTLAPTTTSTTSTTSTTQVPTTTIAPEVLAATYSEPGPYPVGVRTVTIPKGLTVEIWYPAVEGTAGTETYDVRDFTPPGIKALLTGDAPAIFTYDATRDAGIAGGAFPVVLFSHGFTGMRLQSTFLTSHLASWGMIVLSADHPSRDMFNVLGGTASGDRADAVDDMLQTLAFIEQQTDDPASAFLARADTDQVVAVGHSAGGGSVLGAAADPRIDGYISLASGALDDTALPAKPSFYIAGTNDAVVPPAERTFPAFTAAPPPSLYWELDRVGHNGFDDFCTFGNGAGIIGVAEASGLGGLLDAQPDLRRLGTDGCLEPNAPVTDVFPIIRHAATAWIRALFAIDAAPVGLGPEVAGAYPVTVVIESKER